MLLGVMLRATRRRSSCGGWSSKTAGSMICSRSGAARECGGLPLTTGLCSRLLLVGDNCLPDFNAFGVCSAAPDEADIVFVPSFSDAQRRCANHVRAGRLRRRLVAGCGDAVGWCSFRLPPAGGMQAHPQPALCTAVCLCAQWSRLWTCAVRLRALVASAFQPANVCCCSCFSGSCLLAACLTVLYTPDREHFGIVPLECMVGHAVATCGLLA
jgi:hypothetical protein